MWYIYVYTYICDTCIYVHTYILKVLCTKKNKGVEGRGRERRKKKRDKEIGWNCAITLRILHAALSWLISKLTGYLKVRNLLNF